MFKFCSNYNLRNKLLSTKDKILVEASPWDRIWGIGFSSYDALMTCNVDKWGMSLLGKVLMKVREDLKAWDE